jgi:hypothetical protein
MVFAAEASAGPLGPIIIGVSVAGLVDVLAG